MTGYIEDLATHDSTHNKVAVHALEKTYAAIRDLQVIERLG